MKTSKTLFSLLVTLLAGTTAIHAQNYPPAKTDVRIEQTSLPIVFINTMGQSINRDLRISARMTIVANADGVNYADTVAHPHQRTDYQGYVGLRHRGNSSFSYSDKKPYSIKLITDSYENGGKKRKAALLGMGEDDDWALLAPYNDRSMIRNALSMELAAGYLEYVPKTRFCELILDGVYYGVHSLTERVRRGSGRLDLKKPGDEGDDLTGGYIVCIDRNDEPVVHESQYHPTNSAGEVFSQTIFMQYSDPSYDEITEAQRNYIDSRFDAFEDALAADNFEDENEGYRKYIDVSSFIDYQLSTEISNNIDGYRLSTYLYKYRDSVDPRFKMTLWDMDIAWGLAEYENIHTGHMPDVWTYKNNDAGLGTKMPFWFDRLMQDPAYVEQLKARYAEYRTGRYADVPSVVDSLTHLLISSGAVEREFEAWPRWGQKIFNNWLLANSYDEEISYLKDYITARIAWLDQQLDFNPQATAIHLSHAEASPAIYSAGGVRLNRLQPGLNIIRQSDGTVRKVFVKP